MQTDVVTATPDMDQEAVAKLVAQRHLLAIPVVDADRRMQGIVTVDDIVDVVQEEASEDIQKVGGMEALDAPYLEIGFWAMVKKRAGWLAILFVGEMLTATAMGYFEKEIAKAVVLALFVPLIISSGGNSGSQATTLVIRAMAMGEVRLRDWWRIAHREISTGFVLGTFLATIGLARILLWQGIWHTYGPHYMLVALTVAGSLIGVVLFGSLAGSMLPFILRGFRLDPASASAPFVATLVDVTGLVIYFTVASLIMRGTLL
jgi:magnesium transporter